MSTHFDSEGLLSHRELTRAGSSPRSVIFCDSLQAGKSATVESWKLGSLSCPASQERYWVEIGTKHLRANTRFVDCEQTRMIRDKAALEGF